MIAPSSRKRFAVAILAGVMSVAAMAVAQASDADVPRLSVRYDDLDINTEKGALDLYTRISKAAREVCPAESKYSMRVTDLSRRCVKSAIARAVHEVNSPQLAKVEAARSKRTTATEG